jgi:hypothetical protein
MIDLDRLCGGVPAAGLTLAQIQRRCTHLEQLWTPDALNVTLTIVSGLLVAVCVLIRRVTQGEGAGWVVLNVLEGLFYGALAAWFGAIAGQTLALLVEPVFFGVMLLVFAVLAVLIMIAAAAKGTAGAIKVVGVLAHLGLAAALVVVAVSAFMVPTSRRAGNPFESYLLISGVVFTLTAVAGALIVSMYRGYHWAAGWLLVPINASWGALGNLLGLMNHVACLYYYNDWGQPDERRRWYVRYDGGFQLKSNFDFTEGDAMSGNGVEPHEGVHVLQHFIFGPIYPLSHGAWLALWFLPGIIFGAIYRTVSQGIMDFTYYNNPWEVVAYAFGGTRKDTAALQPLIFNDIAAWIIAVGWILAATAGLIIFLALRL